MKLTSSLVPILLLICGITVCASVNTNENEILKNKQAGAKHRFLTTLLPVTNVVGAGRYGGVDCVACTLMIYMVEQLSIIHNNTIDEELEVICDLFPGAIAETCTYLVSTYGAEIIHGLANFRTADQVCHQDIGVCTNSTCHLFPKTEERDSKHVYAKMITRPVNLQRFKLYQERNAIKSGFSDWEDRKLNFDPWKWLESIFATIAHHRPIVDFDGDLYSSIDTLRGAYWRGRDCNDFSSEIYPGRKTTEFSSRTDYNCNGIKGVDAQGNSYKKDLCEGSGQRGVAIIGDSAAAHFHIPVPYFVPHMINETTFNHLLDPFAEDEADWPMRSWSTGHLNDTTGDCPGPLDSIYLRMRERNLCNHRDYQTCAVNGASTQNIWGGQITNSVARHNKTDHPLLLFFALIGNDVCHPEHSLDRMTTVAEFEKAVVENLTWLDNNVIPPGSFVVFEGLANGSFLYSQLHSRNYPLSDEITYEDVYNFLNCLEVAPCWTWMNDDKEIRDAATNRAYNLSKVYDTIIKNYKFKNFEMAYTDFPQTQVIGYWESKGGEAWQLIEPLDGFHPNQIFQSLEARFIWEWLEKEHPNFIGDINPHNAEIRKLFGAQGGY